MTTTISNRPAQERIEAAIKAAETVLGGGMSLADAVCAALYVADHGSTQPENETRKPWAWAADFTAVGSGLLITREAEVAAAWEQTAQETQRALGKSCAVIPLYAEA